MFVRMFSLLGNKIDKYICRMHFLMYGAPTYVLFLDALTSFDFKLSVTHSFIFFQIFQYNQYNQ